MILSSHAQERFNERLSITEAEFFDILANKSVLERVEKTGVRHYVIYVPEDSEHFCVVASDTTVITLMPLIWRAKQVSPAVLTEARELATGEPTVREIKKVLLKKTEAMIHYQEGKHGSTRHFGSMAVNHDGTVNTDLLRYEIQAVREKHKISPDSPLALRLRLDNTWTPVTL